MRQGGCERYTDFENGKPTSSDSKDGSTFERNGDLTIIRIGTERF